MTFEEVPDNNHVNIILYCTLEKVSYVDLLEAVTAMLSKIDRYGWRVTSLLYEYANWGRNAVTFGNRN